MHALARIFSLATVAFSAMLLQACTTTDSSVGGSNQNNLNAECKPGEQKIADDGCNTCSCQQNGFWACTEKACSNPGVCKPGETKKADDGCNTCTCGADGSWGCTLMGCVAECKPGETKIADDGCNTCSCQQNGTWACTEKACVEPCDGPMPPCAAPPPGCDYVGGGCVNGSWTCGKLVCNSECKPGEVKDAGDGCNTCFCGDDGTWACTKKACGPECAPQDAQGIGPCDAFFGYAWNGKECVGLGGCSCQGTDCDKTYSSVEECKKVHLSCGTSLECVVDSDCPPPPPFCNVCPDGTEICPSVACLNGMCVMSEGGCAGGGVGPGLPCDKPGVKAPADDGCNTCICGDNLTWSCTKIGCNEPCDGPMPPCAAPPPGCSYVGGGCVNGSWTCGKLVCNSECKPGEVKDAGDGCNTCFCGDDGTWACTEKGCAGSCDPQDAKGVGPCAAFFGYAWNGKECVGLGGCSCEGADCKSTYSTPEECKKAHQGCNEPPPVCKTDNDCPQPNGPCLKCMGISTCPKNVCDQGTCVYVAPTCGDSCEPQDAKSDGELCDAWFGYFWNGKSCTGFSGCGCKGEDCGKAYPSQAICESIHAVCK
jgi:hypothetical protein